MIYKYVRFVAKSLFSKLEKQREEIHNEKKRISILAGEEISKTMENEEVAFIHNL